VQPQAFVGCAGGAWRTPLWGLEALIKQIFAIPAHTAEGRRAKAAVLLGCILDDDWRGRDEETDWPELTARNS